MLRRALKHRALVGFLVEHHLESLYRFFKAGNIISPVVPVSEEFREAKSFAQGTQILLFHGKVPFPTYYLTEEGMSNR